MMVTAKRLTIGALISGVTIPALHGCGNGLTSEEEKGAEEEVKQLRDGFVHAIKWIVDSPDGTESKEKDAYELVEKTLSDLGESVDALLAKKIKQAGVQDIVHKANEIQVCGAGLFKEGYNGSSTIDVSKVESANIVKAIIKEIDGAISPTFTLLSLHPWAPQPRTPRLSTYLPENSVEMLQQGLQRWIIATQGEMQTLIDALSNGTFDPNSIVRALLNFVAVIIRQFKQLNTECYRKMISGVLDDKDAATVARKTANYKGDEMKMVALQKYKQNVWMQTKFDWSTINDVYPDAQAVLRQLEFGDTTDHGMLNLLTSLESDVANAKDFDGILVARVKFVDEIIDLLIQMLKAKEATTSLVSFICLEKVQKFVMSFKEEACSRDNKGFLTNMKLAKMCTFTTLHCPSKNSSAIRLI